MENTAKNFALQLGSLVTLYISITALIVLLFGVITVKFEDPAQDIWVYDAAASGIRFGIALLIVFFPAYIVLTRMVNTIRRKEHGTYLNLTKWLIYLSLLIGGATLLGDLVAVINQFLNGELVLQFILKALSFFIVVGAAFVYYLMDARGYWEKNERASIQYGAGATAVVVATLVLGFMSVEPPAIVREMRIDAQQVNDLGMIQSQIITFYQLHSSLPESLGEAYGEIEMPTATAERDAYSYVRTGDSNFKLCATFAYPSSKSEQAQYTQPMYPGEFISQNWNHAAGEWCFERNVSQEASPKSIK